MRHKWSAGKCVGGVRHAQVNVCLQQTPKSSHKRTSIWMLATKDLIQPLLVLVSQHQFSGSQRSQSESVRNRGKEQEGNGEKLTKIPS